MHIGYDAKRLFHNYTGLGNYSRTLLRSLATFYPEQAYFLYSPSSRVNSETQYFMSDPAFSVRTPRGPFKAWWRRIGVKRQLKRDRIALYHGLSHEIPFGLKQEGIKSIVTIHDLIFLRYPEQYRWADRQIYSFKFRHACRHADAIVAISESTKKDIIHYFGIPPEKIHVIYQSGHERFLERQTPQWLEQIRLRYQLPARFLLYVGSVIERKNLLQIVKALAMMPASDRLPLVIVGRGKAYLQQVIEYARSVRLDSLLYFPDPSHEDLPAIYQLADMLIYPSFCEGFGIPVLEALWSYTPVITSNISSLPEAAGPHACLVDPASPEQIAEGIFRILSDEAYRQYITDEGYAYSRRFLPEVTAPQMMSLYEGICEPGLEGLAF
jgi:glycosyltransferase involved in cell wall biosynthesis